MILKITYNGKDSTDLGFLLHKNPARPQVFDMSFGQAYVFYPEANAKVTTVALLLNINPIDLVRGKEGSRDVGLFDYVNDRPYVSSSFMSTAISKVFSSALAGRCEAKPELVNEKLDLKAEVTMLPCFGGKSLIDRIFAPLGYTVDYTSMLLEDKFSDWGDSRYVNLTLSGLIKLSDLLNHLYVLLPVFDNQKHYWISDAEVDKLINHGEGWLNNHPMKSIIAARYLKSRKSLIDSALNRLVDESTIDDAKVEKQNIGNVRLNDQRLQLVASQVAKYNAKTVIDLGCGDGKLISLLCSNKELTKIAGVDVSLSALQKAKTRVDRLPPENKERICLMHGSLNYRDGRFSGYDVACVVEVIEHFDGSRLHSFERVVFEYASSKIIILTTPNAEYNVNYTNLMSDEMRHSDHRFEWTRKEFAEWAEKVCDKYNYTVELSAIGESTDLGVAPTQMGVFKKCE